MIYLVNCLLLGIKNIPLAKIRVKFTRPFLTIAPFFWGGAWLVGSQFPNGILITGLPGNSQDSIFYEIVLKVLTRWQIYCLKVFKIVVTKTPVCFLL